MTKKDIHATKSPDFDPSSILDDSEEILERCRQKGFDPNLLASLKSVSLDHLRLAFLLPHLPPFSSPKEFPPDFPVELLPPKYRPPQATAEDLCIGLHEALQSIDPVMAGRWHWRDLRKVRRSLEVALCTGKLMSDLVAEQDQIDNRARESQEERIP
jgi:tRNA dimethylallyltransferase